MLSGTIGKYFYLIDKSHPKEANYDFHTQEEITKLHINDGIINFKEIIKNVDENLNTKSLKERISLSITYADELKRQLNKINETVPHVVIIVNEEIFNNPGVNAVLSEYHFQPFENYPVPKLPERRHTS